MKGEKLKRLEGSCCLVTGGAGFIGSTIVDQLLDAGAAEIRVLDNFVRGSWTNLESAVKRGVKVTDGDIRDAGLVDHLCDGADYVFHEAALRITRCAEAPREAVEVLIDGMLNLLESSVRHNVKKIIAASSASVYGEPSYLPIDEDHPFNNRTMYGAGKIANEQMLRAYFTTSGLPYVAFRYFNAYGPRMDTVGVYTEVMIRWLDAIEANQPPLIFGDGKQSMDFIFVSDIARANLLAAQSDVSDEAFNVGTGIQTSLNELCQLMLDLSGSRLRPEYREARKVGNVQARRASVEKAEKMLGFKSDVSLQEGLRRLIGWKRSLAPVRAVTTEVR
ncbi:MAG TPA: NAD-dependent epimerase/dehydratase family protein [Candidatus Sulfotelmatobacter sp.]|nr:NAD-dependent epimerase/dehydratase family protein [Candidatus Sulfotelmatobacter sp.]